ncbi:hypothetical protein AOCH_004024 [Aspergillus ochraceoroseus]|uniref:Transcription factor IIIC putative zinc-finger domain-containing protein n=1 Tax=Aspergillus ochraceoroseus TaxID=138278 RepID=A0A0F8VAD7_9EURO|nr:hypothetical protein AOCH_004024 [Aspergillus ochraceoroseus]
MLDPVELQVFPSCYNCISCSDEGEIAIATGEYVQILTPRTPSGQKSNGAASNPFSNGWHTTRFRANVFTSNEWPVIFPQSRDNFSIGAEQSLSTVTGLAWSPPGLARYKRSVLAVLTSNMLLSLYEAVGTQAKWTRTAIINSSLEQYFDASIDGHNSRLKKTNIRSFTWTPPLKIPTPDRPYPVPESRWGIPLLAAANDDNVVIFLRFQLPYIQPDPAGSFQVEVLSTVSLDVSQGYSQVVQPGSVFASALQSQAKLSSLASGPWIYSSQHNNQDGGICAATLNVAATHGPNLKFVKLSVTIPPLQQDLENEPRYKLLCNTEENSMAYIDHLKDFQFTGPIRWTQEVGCIWRVINRHGSCCWPCLITLPEEAYHGKTSMAAKPRLHHYTFFEPGYNGREYGDSWHYERISGMTVASATQSGPSTLHLATVGGYTAAVPLSRIEEAGQLSRPPWQTRVDDIREQFDIDRDLGGLAVSRIWGVASTGGLVIVALTMHPGDMVEYRTNTEERLTLFFSTPNGDAAALETLPFGRGNLNRSADFLRERRDMVIQYVLQDEEATNETRNLCPKILYAAACCAIVQSHNSELLSQARKVLERLAASTGVDLTEEIAKSSSTGNVIGPKSPEQLGTSGHDIFEHCEVCDAGIAWDSAKEAQCAAGHVFVRCNLTFLAIQEPGVSKFCSVCKSEYLDEGLIGLSTPQNIQQTYNNLSSVFDTCIYCNGKFRP